LSRHGATWPARIGQVVVGYLGGTGARFEGAEPLSVSSHCLRAPRRTALLSRSKLFRRTSVPLISRAVTVVMAGNRAVLRLAELALGNGVSERIQG